jgi:hypothetical protein
MKKIEQNESNTPKNEEQCRTIRNQNETQQHETNTDKIWSKQKTYMLEIKQCTII